jgi:outer membrane putative beta-barrel porin/alpha-amylase
MQRLKRWRALILLGAVTPLLGPWPVSAQRSEAEQKAEDVQKQAEEAQRALDIFLREQRVLFKRGELALELGLFYSQDTNDTFLRSGPDTVFAKLTKRTFIPSLTLRYGLVNDLELDLLLPFYGYAEQKIDVGTARLRMSDAGLGDIAGLVRYQVWHERGSSPDVIVDVGFKSRTAGDSLLGTGNWNIGGGITLVKTLDPVVFFGRVGYTYTFEHAGLDRGNQIAFLGGTGFSLNDRVSLSMQVNGIFETENTKLNGRTISGSSQESVSLQLGVTVQLTKHVFVEPLVSFGLTDDAPDVVLGFNIIGIKLPF